MTKNKRFEMRISSYHRELMQKLARMERLSCAAWIEKRIEEEAKKHEVMPNLR
jgi:predicted HicB family RNase H-like nuclease